MANETKRSTSSKEEEAKLVTLYQQLKQGDVQPSPELQRQLVFQLLDTKIAQLDQMTDRLKHLRNMLRIGTLAASGLATVVLGLKGARLAPQVAQDVALVLTASATFLASLAAFWDVDSYWLRNKVMLNKLKELRYRFAFAITGGESHQGGEAKSIFYEVIGALGDEYWEKMLNRSIQSRMDGESAGHAGRGRGASEPATP